MARPQPVRVCVAGATGLVGRALLAQLAGDARTGPVTALVRRAGTALDSAPGVLPLVVDYPTLGRSQTLPATDWAFCALGTTIQAAGSQAAFRAVDADAVLSFALAARAAGATRLGVVSAMGADASAAMFYNRVKGEVEQALAAQGWPHLVVARPALLLGDRSRLGQAARTGEAWAQRLMPALGWLLPRALRPISATAVAVALLEAVATAPAGVSTLASDALQALADRTARR